jgi:hypothetical protein
MHLFAAVLGLSQHACDVLDTAAERKHKGLDDKGLGCYTKLFPLQSTQTHTCHVLVADGPTRRPDAVRTYYTRVVRWRRTPGVGRPLDTAFRYRYILHCGAKQSDC